MATSTTSSLVSSALSLVEAVIAGEPATVTLPSEVFKIGEYTATVTATLTLSK